MKSVYVQRLKNYLVASRGKVQERLVDLDEMVPRCRDEVAKESNSEALACYRAGAFRACIVTTWLAVVFDFVAKLREMAGGGHGEASVILKEFDAICADLTDNRVGRSQKFEREVLSYAKDKLQLLSPFEHDELERLYKDRYKCAHPSLSTIEQIYQPSAESARYHLRNAIMYMLQQPPVQGRAAIDAVLKVINSQTFPGTVEAATQRLEQGLMKRANETLVKGVVIKLTSTLLSEQVDSEKRSQRVAALQAIHSKYFEPANEIIEAKLDGLVSNLKDNQLNRVVGYLSAFSHWDYLSMASRERIKTFLRKVPSDSDALLWAAKNPNLKPVALARANEIPTDMFLKFLQNYGMDVQQLDLLVSAFVNSSSFASTRALYPSIRVAAKDFSPEQVRTMLKGFEENSQIRNESSIDMTLWEVARQTFQLFQELEGAWKRTYHFIEDLKKSSRRDEPSFGIALQSRLRSQYPDLQEDTDEEEEVKLD